ncbi:ankyrin [Favolaschia claudopus]|uniref:Ankyrin n=1 Tax=Favolaschia claudopus TaxID=2862362 RepID=A0AAW0CV53_9AGAR
MSELPPHELRPRSTPPDSVFKASIDQYLQSLNRVEAQWLEQIASSSWEPVIAELEALNKTHKDSNATRKLLSRVRCFTDALQPFLKSFDTIMTSGGEITGLIWGALRLIIEITHKFTDYFSIISDTLETISVELPIFRDYVDKLYPGSNTVEKAVAIIVEDIFTVFLLIRKVFLNDNGRSRSLLSITVKVLSQDMQKVTTHLEKHRKNLQVHVDHAERMANREEREKSAVHRRRLEAKILSDEKRAEEIAFYQKVEKFQALLNAPKCWEKHAATLQIYQQPECWLLHTTQYRKWSEHNCGLLWCHSKPGAGKTVLSSVIIDDLQQKYRNNPDIPVLFFYCEYDNPEKRQTSRLVASILDQLMYNPDVLALVKDTWMNESPNLQHLGCKNLQSLIMQLLQQSSRSFIVIDGLDECDNPDEVTSILVDLAASSCILITSRTETEEIGTILGQQDQIHITPSNVQTDIEFFVAASLHKHRRISKRSPEIKQQITKVLSRSANGM